MNEVMPWSKAGGRRCIAPRSYPPGPTRSAGPKKFTEPVALSSTFPVNLRLPPTALGSGFDLLAPRARCKSKPRARGNAAQGVCRSRSRNLRELLQTHGEFANAAVHYKGAGPEIHRAGCAFVHLPREPSASAYGPRERLRPTRAPCSVPEERTAIGRGEARGGGHEKRRS